MVTRGSLSKTSDFGGRGNLRLRVQCFGFNRCAVLVNVGRFVSLAKLFLFGFDLFAFFWL